MNTDPYAPPTADLESRHYPVGTSLWRARGRLSMLAYWAQSGLLMLCVTLVSVGVGVASYGISGYIDLLKYGNLPGAVSTDAAGHRRHGSSPGAAGTRLFRHLHDYQTAA